MKWQEFFQSENAGWLNFTHIIHFYLFQSFLRWSVDCSPCSTLLWSAANRCSSLAVDTPTMRIGTPTSLLEICSCCLWPSSRTRLIRALFFSRTASTLYHKQQEEFKDLQKYMHSDLKVYMCVSSLYIILNHYLIDRNILAELLLSLVLQRCYEKLSL